MGEGERSVRLLTAGAVERVVRTVAAGFQGQTGYRVDISKDTVGALVRRIEGGEAFDIVVASAGAIEAFVRQGKVAGGTGTAFAKVGVGVMVRAGMPQPDVSTVEAFRSAVLNAKSIAYIDPASGGSSGIYVAGLLERLGLARRLKGRTVLKQGGHVADLIAAGEAELGIHQISEILPNPAVTLVGPLPDEIQNYTTYAAGLAVAPRDRAAAEALLEAFGGTDTAAAVHAGGMSVP